MHPDQSQRENDLVLPPNTYVHVLDTTKGKVSAFVGPFKSSLSNTDQLVTWNGQRFVPATTEQAIRTFVTAREGQYIVLSDPAKGDDSSHPQPGTTSEATALETGRKVNIPGPAAFPLWPGQAALPLDGHHLRHNQYVLVRIYAPDLAKENWERAIVAPQTITPPPAPSGEGGDNPPPEDHQAQEQHQSPTAMDAEQFTMGQLIVIKGTDVSFYIPPTGAEVIPEGSGDQKAVRGPAEQTGKFVRDAVTLERLEYCILLDENGEKRYVKGPDVVFPHPTETFVTDDSGHRKFKAIELNPQSGLYIKVIAAYTDETGSHAEGEELFITGAETAIYFPRPEHSIIRYGKVKKHYAIAIPKGEGRYVLDRTTGVVALVEGPRMFLPDPRYQVIVRRVLDPKTVEVMYPGNDEAVQVNVALIQAQERSGSTHLASTKVGPSGQASRYALADKGLELGDDEDPYLAIARSSSAPPSSFAGDAISRSTEYTPPRTITLDTKYEGAVTMNVWPGYAVMITDKSGNRRVVEGPSNILLEYDEIPMVLELSKGRPKTGKEKLRTVYLRTVNNRVSDRIEVETSDLVHVTLDVSYRVNFVGEGEDRDRWFFVENYVQLLADHCRSRLRNAAKRTGIQEFHRNAIDIVRDALLGKPDEEGLRHGLPFKENGMVLHDVEVLNVQISDADVDELLSEATSTALSGAIELSEAEDKTEREIKLQALRRERMDAEDETAEEETKIATAVLTRRLTLALAEVGNTISVTEKEADLAAQQREIAKATETQRLAIETARNDEQLRLADREVAAFKMRMESITPDLIAAIDRFGDDVVAEALVKALGPAALAAGVTVADLMKQFTEGTPLESTFAAMAHRPYGSRHLVAGHNDRD